MPLNPKVKEMAIRFLYVDIKQNPDVEIFCDHPYTDSWFAFDGKSMVDLHNEENADRWRKQVRMVLDRCDDLGCLLMMLSKRYYLTLMKHTLNYLSKEELGELLGEVWPVLENPSTNIIFSKQKLLNLFVKADKTTLMDSDDTAIYNALEDKITVYRGVNVKESNANIDDKYWKALSWTTDPEQAEWYARRWTDHMDNSTMVLFETEIYKEDVLAAFEYENEIIVNFKKLKPEDIDIYVLTE